MIKFFLIIDFLCKNILLQSDGSFPISNFQLFFQLLMNHKDIRLDLLRKIELNPEFSQRELSKEMSVSLGKVNYCIKKLTEKGWIKLKNFHQNPNKVGYAYLLTVKDIEERTKLTLSFLKKKDYRI
jgi:EPS-associated MarR family transcriptional regulator